MASNKSVVVLAPNGRRQTVKVTPNTTILQILEEVCKKQGYVAQQYDIKHHNKCLDTSCLIGFSGLPNNAQLELAEAVKIRVEEEVTIGVQLEDGNRLVGCFPPSSTLWDVAHHLCPEEIAHKPNAVVIYMRKEVYGDENLKNTTLRSMGITGGRVMLRLIHKSPEQLHTQANVSSDLPVKPPPIIEPVYKTPERKPPPNNEEKSTTVAPKPVEREQKDEPKQGCSLVDLVKKEKRKVETSPPGSKKVHIIAEPSKQFDEKDFVFLGERNAMIFSLETAQSFPSEDLPDEFFELTIGDAKKLLRDMKKRRIEMENAPLQTQAYRDLQESTKQLRQMNRYRQCVIRILFPDRTVLQGTFKPTETIEHVTQFVKGYLEDRHLSFYLYTTPPKETLDVSKTLVECGCLPSAILYFGTESLTNRAYLQNKFLSKFSDPLTANSAAATLREKSTRPKTQEEINAEEEMPEESNINVGASTSKGVTFTDYPEREDKQPEKLPKWFKPL